MLDSCARILTIYNLTFQEIHHSLLILLLFLLRFYVHWPFILHLAESSNWMVDYSTNEAVGEDPIHQISRMQYLSTLYLYNAGTARMQTLDFIADQ